MSELGPISLFETLQSSWVSCSGACPETSET